MDFTQDPRMFIDDDTEIAIELKQFKDRRDKQNKERIQMGITHLQSITEDEVSKAGVSKKEFTMIKKLLALDNDIFSAKDANSN